MSNVYDNSSIDLQIGANRIRLRPASMLGSSGLAGARHGFTEIYGNGLDEHTSGYGNRFDVCYYQDGSVSLRDYGRGVPLGWNDKPHIKNWNWHVIYNELYGGGKYETNQKALSEIKDWKNFNPRDYNYLYSVGLNGLGAASTQYTSEFFIVKSYKNGKVTSREFKRGVPLVNGEPFNMFTATPEEIKAIPEEIEDTDEPDGTFIHWKPDDTVFDDVNLGSDWLLTTCRDIASIAGIELHFKDYKKNIDIVIEPSTLEDLVQVKSKGEMVLNKEKPVILKTHNFVHGTTKVEGNPNFIYVAECDIAIGFTTAHCKNACYHNSVKMVNGMQYEAIDDALAQFLTEQAKNKGVKIASSDYDDCFCVIVSSYSNYASFRNQTKDGIDDQFIYNMVHDAILTLLKEELAKGNKDVSRLVDRVVKEAEIRIAAKEQAQMLKEANKVANQTKVKDPNKFTSCDAYENKDYKKAELWIAEGDSASGALIGARDAKFQAVIPIRGKALNVTKNSLKDILDNAEIKAIFALLGTGYDLNIEGEKTFNIEDLKFNKIVFATDADEDGYQIRVLLFLIFYKLAPDLIKEGHVFIAETPRFGIDLSDGTRLYARNDDVRDKIIKEHPNYTHIERYKGLGEMDAEILAETTVDPKTRDLIPVTCDFNNEFERELIDALFGADVYKQRKQIITAELGGDIVNSFANNELMIEEIESEFSDDSTGD